MSGICMRRYVYYVWAELTAERTRKCLNFFCVYWSILIRMFYAHFDIWNSNFFLWCVALLYISVKFAFRDGAMAISVSVQTSKWWTKVRHLVTESFLFITLKYWSQDNGCSNGTPEPISKGFFNYPCNFFTKTAFSLYLNQFYNKIHSFILILISRAVFCGAFNTILNSVLV